MSRKLTPIVQQQKNIFEMLHTGLLGGAGAGPKTSGKGSVAANAPPGAALRMRRRNEFAAYYYALSSLEPIFIGDFWSFLEAMGLVSRSLTSEERSGAAEV
jgi:hypothetical protein